jgi:hypothetical protein
MRSYTVDGWGELTTPFGTFDALRVKMEIDAVDSVFIELLGVDFETERSSVEYHWLGLESGLPILQVTYTSDLLSSIIYQDEGEPVEIEEVKGKVSVYPNPCQEILNIDGGKGVIQSVAVMSTDGKEVHMVDVSGEKEIQIDVRNWVPAVYYLEIITAEGKTIEKILVY